MKRLLIGLVGAWMIVGLSSSAQPQAVFKLGTFERAGKTFVGVVLRDVLVIDLGQALAAPPVSSRVRPPGDMKDLIARYDAVRPRILEVVGRIDKAGTTRPAYVFDVKDVKMRPPIMYPTTMLNVAVNYREHAQEMAGRETPSAQPAQPRRGRHRAPRCRGRRARAGSGNARRTTRDGTLTCSSSSRAP